MKFIDIFLMASSNMFRSKLRTILTIIAIFVGSFTITLTLGLSSGISTYIDKQLGSIGADDVLIVRTKVNNPLESGNGLIKYDPSVKNSTVSPSSIASIILKADDIEKIKKVDGIISVKPVISASPSYIKGVNDQKYEINITQNIDGANIDLVAGHKLNDNKNEILLPVKYVEALGFSSAENAIGKTISFGISNGTQTIPAEVSAVIAGVQQESIFSTTSGSFVSVNLISELHEIQTASNDSAKERYMGVIARFDKKISEKDLIKIKDSLAKEGYQGTTIKDQIGIIKQIIDAITYVLIFFGAIALLAASFGIINTLFMAVQERTKEIGLMKAMGMSKTKIFTLFSIEAILIGLWGSVIGILAAVGIGKIANSIASKGFLKDLPGFDLTVFPISNLAVVVLLIAGIAFLAGTLPARRAAKLDPINALRYE